MPVLKNAKHERFAHGIVAGKSGREAYREAGYSATDGAADTNASRLLKKAQVAARIAELKGKAAEAAGITAKRVLDELAKIGFANIEDYIRITSDGDPAVDLSKMTRDQAAAVAQISVEDFKDGRGEDARDVRKITFKLHDKRAALVDLGKHLGLFKDQVEVAGKNGGPIETKDVGELEVARRIAFLLTSAARKEG